MVDSIIRKGADGFELNFGPLVVVELDGIKFAMEDWRAKQLALVYSEEEIPEFLTELKLTMQYPRAQISAFVFSKADIKPLGAALSMVDTLGYPDTVDAGMCARILMMWARGEVVRAQVTLDHFYSNLTEEEIEASRF